MSRKHHSVILTVAALGASAVAVTVGSSNMANSAGGQPLQTNVDFDHTFDATVAPRIESTPEFMTTTYFGPAVEYAMAAPQRDNALAMMTKHDFEKTFAAAAPRQAQNTPLNREKLRNEGWKRILGSN
jgi:hypothetical protein